MKMKSRVIEGGKAKEYLGTAAHLWVGEQTVILVAENRKALRESYDYLFPEWRGGLDLSKCQRVKIRKAVKDGA